MDTITAVHNRLIVSTVSFGNNNSCHVFPIYVIYSAVNQVVIRLSFSLY